MGNSGEPRRRIDRHLKYPSHPWSREGYLIRAGQFQVSALFYRVPEVFIPEEE